MLQSPADDETKRGRGEERKMMTDWLYGWSQSTVGEYLERGLDGAEIGYLYSGQFSEKPSRPNDAIYIVHAPGGELHLIGRMHAAARTDNPHAAVYSRDDVDPDHSDDPTWSEVIKARPGSGTTMMFDRPLPLEVARRLRFEKPNYRFRMDAAGLIEPMAIVQIRRLAYHTAGLLDGLLRDDE